MISIASSDAVDAHRRSVDEAILVAWHERQIGAHLAQLAEAVAAGEVRTDVPARELAAYCLHALTAAGGLPSTAAVGRLVDVTLARLQPPQQ